VYKATKIQQGAIDENGNNKRILAIHVNETVFFSFINFLQSIWTSCIVTCISVTFNKRNRVKLEVHNYEDSSAKKLLSGVLIVIFSHQQPIEFTRWRLGDTGFSLEYNFL
jgi:hypothetical protein